MQRLIRLLPLWGGLIFWLAAGVWGQGSQKLRPPQSQIEEFYADYNFICSLSTRQERARLAAHLDGDDPPPDMTDRRLIEIFHRMRRIQESIHVQDPEMVKPLGKPWRRLEHLFQADGYEVSRLSLTDDGAAVEVRVYHLEPEQVMHFIREFEQTIEAERQPDPEEWLASQGRAADLAKEVHLWKPWRGKWMKLDSHFTFLEHKR